MISPPVFLPGVAPPPPIPLGRFLPPLPSGMATLWLEKNHLAGEWVLDPLGTSPTLVLEAARAGCRVLVACNNPVIALIIEVLCCAPPKAGFQAALADLATSRRGEERLETHLQSLYQTECDSCKQAVIAQVYLWKRGQDYPYARVYQCRQCGNEGEHPIREADIKRLQRIRSEPLHQARALSRIAHRNDPIFYAAQDALKAYQHRALYFLITLINRVEGLPLPADRRNLLLALALIACDEGNTLWANPSSSRSRPRQLVTPPQFREKNLWNALEDAINLWSVDAPALPCTRYPAAPPESGGVCIFHGRFKQLQPIPNALQPAALLSVLPRPNQAFWTLSAIWCGWLWGHEAVKPMRAALERRRYDWSWHANALSSLFTAICKNTRPGLPYFLILPEIEPGFLAAALLASASAGLTTNGVALRAEHSIAQLNFGNPAGEDEQTQRKSFQGFHTAIRHFLAQRREPSPYSLLHAACLKAAIKGRDINHARLPGETLSTVQTDIEKTIQEGSLLRRFEQQSQKGDRYLWWLSDDTAIETETLSDAVELWIIKYLLEHPQISLHALDRALCADFPGLLTPNYDLVVACLESYTNLESDPPPRWSLRERERFESRQNDVRKARQRLEKTGIRLGFHTGGEDALLWSDAEDKPVYHFQFSVTAAISRWLFSSPPLPERRNVLVIPGSRSNLLAFKLQRDPRLAEAAAKYWRFIKFRHVRRMFDRKDLTAALWEEMLEQDPPRWEDATQMKIFETG